MTNAKSAVLVDDRDLGIAFRTCKGIFCYLTMQLVSLMCSCMTPTLMMRYRRIWMTALRPLPLFIPLIFSPL